MKIYYDITGTPEEKAKFREFRKEIREKGKIILNNGIDDAVYEIDNMFFHVIDDAENGIPYSIEKF